MQHFDLTIDVTSAANLGEPAHVAVRVVLPDPAAMAPRPVVCFGKPGGGYSKGYYTEDLPGPAKGAQAAWHAARGWIFVAIDHLGVGDSSLHSPEKLPFVPVVAGNNAAEQEVLRRLAEGTLAPGFPKVANPLKLGIGQSMGGYATILQQGRYHGYDGIGVLGYSAIHTHPPVRPGEPPIVKPLIPRDPFAPTGELVVLNAEQVAAAPGSDEDGPRMAWGFHWDDVPADLQKMDLLRFQQSRIARNTRSDDCPAWGSDTFPGVMAGQTLCPGAVTPEAAAVRVPVLCAMGERDVIADPWAEPRAFKCSPSVDLFVCPRMGHMHNFASTRELFWAKIDLWGRWVGIQAGR